MREIEVHTSERGALYRCHQMWWWKYRMGLVPKYGEQDALWFGIGVHEALAKWYLKGKKRGPHPAQTWQAYCGNEEREIRASLAERDREWYDEAKFEDARKLGTAMLEGYIDKWGKDPRWHVIAIEQPFRVNVMHNGQRVAKFASTWDGVYRDEEDDEIYLMEHKTTSQSPNEQALELDPQAGVYCSVANSVLRANGILKPGQEIAGVQYNFLRKAMPDDRPVNEEGYSLNKDGSISKKQPTPAFIRPTPVFRTPSEQQTQMLRLADEVVLMNAMRDGTIPVTKSTTRDCPWCPFFNMCTLHEKGGDAWLTIMKADYIQQDPYEDRRKTA